MTTPDVGYPGVVTEANGERVAALVTFVHADGEHVDVTTFPRLEPSSRCRTVRFAGEATDREATFTVLGGG